MYYQQVCADSDFNTTTMVCSNPQWVPMQTLLPSMDAQTGATISLAIAAVWALGAAWVLIRRAAPQ